ncbi:MAG: UDP-glucose 6-dehydrogenase, partial [Oscillospiraceae bacterium]|nr:UDP-glucose 6-dehydrogenase [Oscillospiraceae bacterium]
RSNDMRKDHIAEMIASKCSGTVGIYRMVMKSSSDNFRHSSILGIIGRLYEKGIRTLIYEPLLNEDTYCGSEVIHNIEEFLERSDLIVANRVSDELKPVMDKVYSRDLFHKD